LKIQLFFMSFLSFKIQTKKNSPVKKLFSDDNIITNNENFFGIRNKAG